MKNKLIAFLKREKKYEYFLRKLAKRNKTLEQHIANINPNNWIDSAFLWEKLEHIEWEEINVRWKKLIS